MNTIFFKNGSQILYTAGGMKSSSWVENISKRNYSFLSKSISEFSVKKAFKNRQVAGQLTCSFQTGSRREALPAVVVLAVAQVSKLGAMFLGRTVRTYWGTLPTEKKVIWKKKLKGSKYIMTGILAAVAIGLGVYYQSHVQEAPITMRKRFIAFTDEEILQSSKEALNYLLLANEGQILPAVPEASEFYDRVLKVSQQLIKGNLDLPEVRDLEWTITVVCDRTNINAFVLSCGSIFIYTGMLALCDNDDQLGIILRHEMAHAILGHTAEVMSLRNFWDILSIIPIAALWAVLPSDLTAYIVNWAASKMRTILMELPYSRFREEEAD